MPFLAAALVLTAHIANYDLALMPDFASQSIRGEETITLDRPGASLDLAAADFVVSEVRDATGRLPFVQRDGRLQVTLTHPDAQAIRVRYAGKPASGLRFSAGDQGFTALNTWHWMVCEDDPARKAPLGLALILPKDVDAVASGEVVGRETLADGLVRWR